jgi:hypothetical protein
MTECFQELPIKIYPLTEKIDYFLKDWPENRQDKLVDREFINPDLLDFFDKKKIKIRENFIIWNWQKNGVKLPHTDGDWFSDETVIKKRLCGINWNFSPGTRVEFYSTENATPVFEHRGDYDFSTFWKNCNKLVAVWFSEGPILFNPQVPHKVGFNTFSTNRVSLTLRFFETYDTLKEKLNA